MVAAWRARRRWVLLSSLAVSSVGATRIVCMGDSITEGAGSSDDDFRWTNLLADLLGSSYEVLNSGKSGRTLTATEDWYQESDQYADALLVSPDIVIIGLGTNDAKGDYWSTYGLEYVSTYETWIEEMRTLYDPAPEFLLLIPMPQLLASGRWPDPNVINHELPLLVPAIAETVGAAYADLRPPFFLGDDDDDPPRNPDMYDDMIHPNDLGHEAIAQVVYAAVLEIGPTSRPTSSVPSYSPSYTPSYLPTDHPSPRPTPRPTLTPTTSKPSPRPSPAPTYHPTYIPTSAPTANPTEEPTNLPTGDPTFKPTPEPTKDPTPEPTPEPSPDPTTYSPTTSAPSTPRPSPRPSTPAPSYALAPTPKPTVSFSPTTEAPSTPMPSTPGPTTEAPTTPMPTTSEPTTSEPTTSEPTTSKPTPGPVARMTTAPTTPAPTTPRPSSSSPSTTPPTAAPPTSASTVVTESALVLDGVNPSAFNDDDSAAVAFASTITEIVDVKSAKSSSVSGVTAEAYSRRRRRRLLEDDAAAAAAEESKVTFVLTVTVDSSTEDDDELSQAILADITGDLIDSIDDGSCESSLHANAVATESLRNASVLESESRAIVATDTTAYVAADPTKAPTQMPSLNSGGSSSSSKGSSGGIPLYLFFVAGILFVAFLALSYYCCYYRYKSPQHVATGTLKSRDSFSDTEVHQSLEQKKPYSRTRVSDPMPEEEEEEEELKAIAWGTREPTEASSEDHKDLGGFPSDEPVQPTTVQEGEVEQDEEALEQESTHSLYSACIDTPEESHLDPLPPPQRNGVLILD